MSHTDRIVVLVDMDCFYCQVEEKLNPALKGKPMAVVQYNAWRGGGIIAVNYHARERGVTRHMRGDEAKQKCPEIELVRVPTLRGKANLTKYRDAGKSVAKVLETFTPLLERASVDEAYLDITATVTKRLKEACKELTVNQIRNTHVVGYDNVIEFLDNLYNSGLHNEGNLKLAYGGGIAEEIRATIYEQTGYTCSAGIAHNKILAKLACGLYKPNKQTILPQDSIDELYKSLPVKKIRSLGGKFGQNLSEDLGITTVAELLKFSEKELAKRYDEKAASFLYNIARGIDLDPVTTRLVSKSIGCCKKFPGKSALIDGDSVMHWLNELALELVERLDTDLEENSRKARQIIVSFTHEINGKDVANSRTNNLKSYEPAKIAAEAFTIITKSCLKTNGMFCLKFLGFSAGKFEDCRSINEITHFFNKLDNSHKKQDDGRVDSDASIDAVIKMCGRAKDTDNPSNIEESANFSDITEELNENSCDLVFLDDAVENVSDNDSISNELFKDSTSESNDCRPQKESFFVRYFENVEKQKRTSPVVRDFNTSRNLEESVEETSDNGNLINNSSNKNDAVPAQAEPVVNAIYNMPGTSHNIQEMEESTEICSDCGKAVYKAEMLSHMDYHFAIKMVKEESKMFRTTASPTVPKHTKKQTARKSVKRKSTDTEQSTSLNDFFKVDPQQSDNDVQLCIQCNKRIVAEDFANHLDYHAAKKLHKEINPVKSFNNVEKLKRNAPHKDKQTKKTTKKGIVSITSFFKPTN